MTELKVPLKRPLWVLLLIIQSHYMILCEG